MSTSELERERAYVSTLYARLDELQREAREQLDAVRRQDVGGNHQNRSERDAFARMYEDRIVQLRDVDERLAFGRLELAGYDEPEYRYIGRVGLRDAEQRPLLVDWRAPQASAFYQATAKTPLGTRARRHLLSKGRHILRIEDEVFDAELLEDDRMALQGEGALLAALTTRRTGHMHDIVATIQAEQDRIIRSDPEGVLVVQGGPGTGKTAVALHRAAYLLYSHRDRLKSSGVLIVGPSRSFMHYIEAVLPSLGESGVVLSSVGQLYPGVDAASEDPARVAALKGSSDMAALIARAVRSRQRVPAAPQELEVNGDRITLEPGVIARAIARARERGKPHNVARVTFAKAALAELTRRWAEQLKTQGNTVDESDFAMLHEDLRTAQDVRVALNTAWLPLTPQKLVQDLFARPRWLAELTPGWSEQKRELLHRDRTAPFTVSDVPLLDEAAELLGEFDELGGARGRDARQQRRRDIENAQRAIENMGVEGIVSARSLAAGFAEAVDRGTTAERAAADRTWAYGHIVVDEAQELSAMQWRLLSRRCPRRSFTIVGDIAQAASASAAATWEDALAPLMGAARGSGWRLEVLTVNYRTPSQIAAAADAMALAHGLPVTRARSVRESDWPIRVVGVVPESPAGPLNEGALNEGPLNEAVLQAVRADRAVDASGTIAVIAQQREVAGLVDALTADPALEVGLGSEGLTRPIVVLSPQDAKGLEFDAVVIVDPAGIVDATSRGAAALYVAMTRPTQRLTLVALGDLPAGLGDDLGA
ncbi:AAA family ATPase [Parafrigoribacterium mesophilum]